AAGPPGHHGQAGAVVAARPSTTSAVVLADLRERVVQRGTGASAGRTGVLRTLTAVGTARRAVLLGDVGQFFLTLGERGLHLVALLFQLVATLLSLLQRFLGLFPQREETLGRAGELI